MKTQDQSDKNNASRAVAHDVAFSAGETKPLFSTEPDAVAQARLVDVINQSPQITQLQTFEQSPGIIMPPVQRVVNYPSTKTHLDGVYNAGATVVLDYATLANANHQDTIVDFINNAQLQHGTTMFHGNAHGLLPAYAWISTVAATELSPYIEFNSGNMAPYNRVVYNAILKTVYISPHYAGFIRIDNVPDASVAHLEGIAETNIGYILDGVSKRLNGQSKGASSKIFALKGAYNL